MFTLQANTKDQIIKDLNIGDLTIRDLNIKDLNIGDSSTVNLFKVDIPLLSNEIPLDFTFDNLPSNKKEIFESFDSFTDFVEGKTKSQESKFNPYEDNSGSTVSIRLNNSIIIAADTRHCSEMGIYSRNTSKIFRIGDFLLTITGFYADGYELYNRLKYQVQIYESFNKISIHSLANLASKIMYSKRLFPYYSYVTLSGFEGDNPYVYSFDCLGHFEEVDSVCNGSGSPLIQPLLDSTIEKKNWAGENYEVTEEYVKDIVRRGFNAASERDVKTGDNVEIWIIKKDGMTKEYERLRQD
uniref:Proteasome subunit beta type-6 n=1 Tax=Vairimorpha necatrix TaxID=6039 RepID=UPI002249A2E2|nr:Chain L, Proteasome subunit beta type-6 [Vairimorpha necatrix]8ADN_Z Chain Z, Proteasome subunit beta type-6 [Vairimorpha necatrix]